MNRGGDFSNIYKRNHFVESCLQKPRVGVSCSKSSVAYDIAGIFVQSQIMWETQSHLIWHLTRRPVEAGVRRKRVTIAAITNEPLVRLIVMERSINLFIRRVMGEFVE
jgi:hypothetical protein